VSKVRSRHVWGTVCKRSGWRCGKDRFDRSIDRLDRLDREERREKREKREGRESERRGGEIGFLRSAKEDCCRGNQERRPLSCCFHVCISLIVLSGICVLCVWGLVLICCCRVISLSPNLSVISLVFGRR